MTTDPGRPLIQTGVYILLTIVPLWLFAWVFLFIGNQFAGSILAVAFAALVGNFLCFRIFEGVGLEHLGMPLNRPALRNTATGTALGFAAGAFVIVIPLLSGQAREVVATGAPVNWREALFVPMMLFAGAASEEILFRGFGFQILLRAFGPFSAILPIGVLFGFMHRDNPHAASLAIANTIGFGILFGFAFLRSHDIWFPFGLHFGWNLTLLLFGANISGITIRVTSYEIAWNASPLWSGAEYGPEGSLLTSAALVLLAGAIWKVRVVRQAAYLIDSPSEG